MSGERVELRGAASTSLLSLALRARDARSARPILGDPYARDVLARVDGPQVRWNRLSGAGNAAAVATRARRLDQWTEDFLRARPGGQVLHLGCGLDSRPLRVARPPSARWIDLDQPEVIDLRRRLYELPAGVETIAASLTDTGWWSEVDEDRPTLVLAEGVLMYLGAGQVDTLIDRALSRLRGGRIAADLLGARWTVAASRRVKEFRTAGACFRWAVDSRFEERHPRLVLLDDLSLTGLVADASHRRSRRAAYRLLDRAPPLRDSLRLRRYRFGDDG